MVLNKELDKKVQLDDWEDFFKKETEKIYACDHVMKENNYNCYPYLRLKCIKCGMVKII